MTTLPPSEWLVSVDDHVIEPPRVWLDRLATKYHDRAPRMAQGDRGAVWQYEDKVVPTSGLSVTAGKGKEEFSPDPVSFDEMRFPSFPRFCGQIFWEAKDKDLPKAIQRKILRGNAERLFRFTPVEPVE